MIWILFGVGVVLLGAAVWFHTKLFAAVHERINDVEQMLAKHHDATAKEMNGGVVVRGVLAGVNLMPPVAPVQRYISTDHITEPLVIGEPIPNTMVVPPVTVAAPASISPQGSPNIDPAYATTTFSKEQVAFLNARVDSESGLLPATLANLVVYADGNIGSLPAWLKSMAIFAGDIAEATYCFFVSNSGGVSKVRTSAVPTTPLVVTGSTNS